MEKRSTQIGFALMITAALMLPVADSLAKTLSRDFEPLQIIWLRNVFHTSLFAPFVIWKMWPDGFTVRRKGLHFLRAFCFVGMSIFYVSALRIMPIVDAQTLFFIFPLLVMGLSVFFLQEKVFAAVWLAGCLGLVGTFVVLGPGGTIPLAGAIYALLATSLMSIYMLLNRKLADGGPAMLMILPPLFGSFALSFVMPTVWVAPSAVQWGLFAASGFVFALAHGLVILAAARVVANRLAPLMYFQMVSGVTLGFFVFGDWPAPQVWLGLALIVGAGLIVQLSPKE